MLNGQIGVGQRLRLHALAGVHHQHSTFTGGQAAADLIVEVHMTRRVNQVQDVGLPVVRLVAQGDGTSLDGDAPFPFQIHGVQDLILHLSGGHRPTGFDKPVGQGGLAVVDVSDNREVADVFLVHRVISF